MTGIPARPIADRAPYQALVRPRRGRFIEALDQRALPHAAVNAKIAALRKEPGLSGSINAQWAALDKAVMQEAPWAPFVNVQSIDTFGPDVDLGCYVQHVNYQFDFATICHK